MALGFVVAKFGILLREVGGAHVHPLTARAGTAVGVILVLLGIAVVFLAMMRFLQTREDIEGATLDYSSSLDVALAAILSLITVVLAIYLVATA